VIVEQPVTGAEHRPAILERAPCKTAARSYTQAGCQPLMFHARAVIERETRQQRPMILRISRHFEIGAIERGRVAEIDALFERVARVENLNRLVVEVTLVAGARERTTHLDEVSSQDRDGSERPVFQPFDSAGAAMLLSEVVPKISFRRDVHAVI